MNKRLITLYPTTSYAINMLPDKSSRLNFLHSSLLDEGIINTGLTYSGDSKSVADYLSRIKLEVVVYRLSSENTKNTRFREHFLIGDRTYNLKYPSLEKTLKYQ